MAGRIAFHRLVYGALVVALGVTAMVAASAVKAAPQAPLTVFVKAEHLDGLRPDGSPVTIRLNADVQGDNTSSLTGTGKHFGSGGTHVEWSFTGSLDGDVVTLTGVMTDTNNPDYVGSPSLVIANTATGATTFHFGPLTGGRFVGQTVVVQGEAKVDIRAT